MRWLRTPTRRHRPTTHERRRHAPDRTRLHLRPRLRRRLRRQGTARPHRVVHRRNEVAVAHVAAAHSGRAARHRAHAGRAGRRRALPSRADHRRHRARAARRDARGDAGCRPQGDAGVRRADAAGEPQVRAHGDPLAPGGRDPRQRADPQSARVSRRRSRRRSTASSPRSPTASTSSAGRTSRRTRTCARCSGRRRSSGPHAALLSRLHHVSSRSSARAAGSCR